MFSGQASSPVASRCLPVWRVGGARARKSQKHKKVHETGRRSSKINISGIKMHNFFVPELMVAAVFVKSIVFDQFLNFLFFILFSIFWGWVSQVSGAKSVMFDNDIGRCCIDFAEFAAGASELR